MINKELYQVLMTFGGGKWMSLLDSARIVLLTNKHTNIGSYKKHIKRCIEYGWIRCEKTGLPTFAYKNMFGITKRGSDALEFYKNMRYHHTERRILLSKEGKAMITLPGEKYNVGATKSSR